MGHSIDGAAAAAAHALLVIGQARATRFAPSLGTSNHRSHAVKLRVALESELTIREPGGWTVRAPVLLSPSDMPSLVTSRSPVVTLVLDPEENRDAGRVARAIGRTSPVDPAVARRLCEAVRSARHHLESKEHLVGLGDELHAIAFPRSLQPARFDRRVERALEYFRANLDESDEAATGLPLNITAQHFRSLFLRDVGISPRAWLLWNRLVHCLRIAVSGVSLSMAAALAGFSDHAHFSRTCRRLIGYTPSDILRTH